MKKLSIILGVVLVLLIALPFLIKDQLINKELAKVHQNEGVLVSYQSSSLSLLSFPTISMTLTEVEVKNEDFKLQPHVATCDKIAVEISLSELFKDEPIIQSLNLTKGTVDLFVDQSGKRNFDFSTQGGPDEKKKVLIEQLTLTGFEVRLVDQLQKINLGTTVNSISWNESEEVIVSGDVLLKKLLIDDKTYFTNRVLTVAGICQRIKDEIKPKLVELGVDDLKLTVEPKGGKGWHIYSSEAKIEHCLAALPDFARPNVANLQSNKPLLFDAVVQRRKLKKLLIEAQKIELENLKSGEKIDEINFSFDCKKRDTKLTNLSLKGLGCHVTGHCISQNLKENEIELALDGTLDIKNIIDFFYSGILQGTGGCVFSSEVSKENEVLKGNVDINQLTISDDSGQLIYQLDGGVQLTNAALSFDELIFNPQKENLSLSGTIHQPINFLLLNKQPVKGELLIGCHTVKIAGQNFDDVLVEFGFGFVPSKEFLYIVGLPINPFVSPTYLNLKAVNFVQRDFNEQPVHLAMAYETEEEMHLKELTCLVGDTLLQIELLSEKPKNLALFAFEKQQFWAKCTYNKFSLSNLLKRIGVSMADSPLLTGEIESVVGYQPTKLFSGKKKTVDFTDLAIDLSVNNQQIVATGSAEYSNNKINIDEVTVTQGEASLLKTFLLSFF